ncbi:glycine cleavage system protein GcvH [Lyngbya confervoides]|uniref:Glycine cleavage system H protein n=1 Tax=Lyngbya confervoides BDU141951 TaxID=1574623 RepID=A0ABD4SZ44_9CYAN|nr:glycine cleavage system protein GcvH [Lyngbya confervoides]MCM1981370.1 glycine cleavage system protein GcvH [Lyngbya confervoides BDU141951]
MSFEYPNHLQYLDSHEYVNLDGEIATLGITAFAVDQLGDIVFVELPEVGESITQGEAFGNVESVKAVEELMAPVSGTVTEVNTAVLDSPEVLADSPYDTGWLLKVQLAAPLTNMSHLLSAAAYRQQVEGEA